MVPGRLRQLRLQTFLEKRKGFLFVFVKKDPCEPHGFLRAEIQDHILDLHPFSSSDHFLIADPER
jgi:hypothetical protein